MPKNIAANLSFDLIGFGASDSHITVSDVRVSGLPQLHDDSATLLEDGTFAFDPLAQRVSQASAASSPAGGRTGAWRHYREADGAFSSDTLLA